MRPSLLRKVATGVLLLDALAVGAAAIHVENVVTRSTTALPPVASPPAAPGSARGEVAPRTPGAPLPVASLGGTGDPFAGVLEQLGASGGRDTPSSNTSGPIVTPPPGGGAVPTGEQVSPCPLDLSDPGIQAAVSPVLTPLATTLGALLTPVLETETQLVAALAPYSQALTGDALGGCVVELQGALLAASGSGTSSAAGPTSPDLSALGLGGLP